MRGSIYSSLAIDGKSPPAFCLLATNVGDGFPMRLSGFAVVVAVSSLGTGWVVLKEKSTWQPWFRDTVLRNRCNARLSKANLEIVSL